MSMLTRARAKFIESYKAISSDYITVAKETWSNGISRPGKSIFYVSLFGFGIYARKKVPKEQEYISALVLSSNDLLLQDDGTRNREADNYVQMISQHHAKDRLFHKRLGLFSIIYHNNHGSITKNYRSQCKYTNPRWTHFYKQILDVGFLGRWWRINYMMTDYDINFDELPKEFKSVFHQYFDHIKKIFGYSYYSHLMAQPARPKPYVHTEVGH